MCVCVCVYTDISHRVLNSILRSNLLEKHFHHMSTVIKRKKKFWKYSFKPSVVDIFTIRLSEPFNASVIMNF